MTLFFRMATHQKSILPLRCIGILAFLICLPVATASAVSVTLEWDSDPQPELRGYKIFCRLTTDANYDYDRPVWAGTDGRCDIPGLAPQTDYCFVVRAFDAEGNESGDSNEVFYPGSQIQGTSLPGSDSEPAPLPNTPEPSAIPEGGENTPLTTILENTVQPENEAKAAHAETHWQIFRDDSPSPLCVYDTISQVSLDSLLLPPLVLEEETAYFWRSRYINVDGNGGDWALPQYFTTGVIEGDTDGDGLLDAQVVAPETDMNGDGIRDQTQMKIRPAKTVIGDGTIAVDALGNDDVRAIKSIRSLDPMDVELGSSNGYDSPLGLVAFKLVLAQGVQSASINLHLSHAPGDEMTLHTYDSARGWQNAADLAQLADGGRTVLLTLTDGGNEDVDGVANGLIIFTGGFGRPVDYHGTGAGLPGIKGEASVLGGASVCFIGTAGQ